MLFKLETLNQTTSRCTLCPSKIGYTECVSEARVMPTTTKGRVSSGRLLCRSLSAAQQLSVPNRFSKHPRQVHSNIHGVAQCVY